MTDTTAFSTVLDEAVELLVSGDDVAAAEKINVAIKRWNLQRNIVESQLKSVLFQQYGVRADRYLAAYNAAKSVVR